jgi:hypothetical protein
MTVIGVAPSSSKGTVTAEGARRSASRRRADARPSCQRGGMATDGRTDNRTAPPDGGATRIERDSMGAIEVPAEHGTGARRPSAASSTSRYRQGHLRVGSSRSSAPSACFKQAAAQANAELGTLGLDRGRRSTPCVRAAREVDRRGA